MFDSNDEIRVSIYMINSITVHVEIYLTLNFFTESSKNNTMTYINENSTLNSLVL